MNSQINATTGEPDIALAKAWCNGPKCEIEFVPGFPKGDYRVLSTDYVNYVVVYSCTDIPFVGKFQAAWILTRTQTIPAEQLQSYLALLKERVPEYNQANLYFAKQGAQCNYPKDATLFLE